MRTKEELKKEQIIRLARFMVREYQYSLFRIPDQDEEESQTGFDKLSVYRQKAFLNVAKMVIEDFDF